MNAKRILQFIISVVFIALFLFSGIAQSQNEDTIKIGVLIESSEKNTVAKWTGISEHLSADIPEFTFEIVSLSQSTIEDQLIAGNVDFLIVDPANYVMLENAHGVSSMASMKTIAYLPPEFTQTYSLSNVGSVIFTKADREDIQDLNDIIGTSFLAQESPIFEGWWITKREFVEHRIYPESDFEILEFSRDSETIVYSVENGIFDAGTVPSGFLEKMHKEGKININDFKIINLQGHDDYPLLSSTRLYPGWTFASTKETSKTISERVSVSLFSMSLSMSDNSNTGNIIGWTVHQDHTDVEACMMELKVGMFAGQIDLGEKVSKLKYLLFAMVILLLLATSIIVYARDLNKKLEHEIVTKTEAEEILRRKNLINSKMLEISSMFTHPVNVDEAIDKSLFEIGTLCGADRCYLFHFNENGTLMNNTHEWCAKGVEPKKEELQKLPFDILPLWIDKLSRGEMITVADISYLPPEASTEKQILELLKVRSVILLPVFIEGLLAGFVGLDNVDDIGEWKKDDFDDILMFSTLMAMVIKRRIMEQSLKESEQHLKRVLEGSNEGSWGVDLRDKALIFDDRYAEIIGYPAYEITPNLEWLQNQIHPDDLNCAINKRQNMINNVSKTAECEFRIRGKDGKYRWVYYKGKVVEYSSDGKPLHVAGILVDIADQKETEFAMVATKKAAEDANRAKSEFLANMSHELRTPLNSVIGFSDMLLTEVFGSLNDKQKKYAGNISTSGKHLLSLINDILDLSKVEAGKMVLNIDEFSIEETLYDIKSLVSPMALKKNITLLIEPINDTIVIKADEGKFKQIIYNLLSNAIKFTNNDGYVTIFVNKISDYVRIEVRDTGIGISKEDQKKLFTAFTQIDSSNSRMYDGTGLGLILVKNLVELHNGKIWIESEVDTGTSFIFELPIEAEFCL
jgi:PAS domain S-box-containing protein